MQIYETHAHLDFRDFQSDRDEVLRVCTRAGVSKIINIGIDTQTTESGIKLSQRYPDTIRATAGFHPCNANKYDPEKLKTLLADKHIVAMGEIGLDYYRLYHPIELQKNVFESQVKIAKENDLPIVIHDREAHEDVYAVLNRYRPKKVVFHCFSGDVNFAEKVLNAGWSIGITGVVTYKNSDLADIVRITPRERLLVETDCPYLTPVPHRGQRNSPEYLVYVVQKLAEILQRTPREIAEQTYENATAFFGF
jgi:TatD DNase family protein